MLKRSLSSRTAIRTILIYWHFMWRYPVMLVSALLLLPISVISANILLPLVYANAINTVKDLIGSNNSFWGNFGILFWQTVFLITVSWIVWRIIGYTISTFEFRVKRDLEQHIFKHLTTHSLDFHVNSFSGSLVAQTNRMTGSFERLFDSVYFDLYILFIKITSVMIVLAPKSPQATLVIALWVIGFISVMTFMQIKKMPYSRRAAQADSKVTAALADSLTNIFTIITFGRKSIEQKRFNATSQKRYKIATKDWYISEAIFAFQSAMMFLVEAGMIWLTVSLALQGKITLGDIVLVQFYLMSIMGSMWNFGRVIRNIERSLSDAHEMTVILDQKETVKDPTNPVPALFKKGDVAFDNVVFAYENNITLFNNLTLNIKAGEKVGLVGPSGGGKSTITKLILRLMDVKSGVISIDSLDISRVNQDDLRKSISYVPQEPILFHRSLKENIGYGDPDATDEDIIAAAKASHADEFISTLQDGYDTLVGERGVKLSGGQRQRIAIARAMLKKSPILLLDEATSALDSESEQLIQIALTRLMNNRTTIVIAHRLSTIQHMDRIIVIDKGKVVEQGTHNELLALKDGHYAKLWAHQSGGFIKE